MATGRATVPHRPDSLPGIDILSHDVYAEGVPLDAYDVYRATAPVAWVNETPANGHSGAGFWAITRWDDIVAIHKDWRRFSSEVGGTEIEELEHDAIVARRTMLETDPPRHTRLRQLVNPAFSRATVQTYADHARVLVDDVLSEALTASHGSEPVEAVAMIARELPIRMLTGLLGVPDADAPMLFHWADQIVYHADPEYSEAVIDRTDTDPYRLLPFRSPTSLRVFDYVNRLAAAAHGSDRGDVISVLERALVDGAPLTERERGTFFLLLLIAGNETTRHSLTQTLLVFADHPHLLEQLRDDPSLVDSAVEEALRWACPQLHFRRTATEDVEMRGESIRSGDKVVTWYAAANFDPDQFPEPRRFDIARTPNRHVTFGGGGPHLCLGQWMARLEVRAMIDALIGRVARVERAGEVERIRSNFINGIKRASIVLHAR
jgi:cytochrome P450